MPAPDSPHDDAGASPVVDGGTRTEEDAADDGGRALDAAPDAPLVPGSGGKLDTAYGYTGGGTSLSDPAADVDVRALSLLPDGRVLYGAGRNPTDGTSLVGRLLTNGMTDPAFGGGQPLGVSPSDLRALTAGPDGRLVLTSDRVSSSLFAIASDGTLDTTFGTAGKALAPSPFAGVGGIAADATGFVVASDLQRGGGNGYEDMALFRYTAAGALDTTFGANGIASHAAINGTSARACTGPAAQASGMWIVACGLEQIPSLALPGVLVSRFSAAGVLDTTFGSGGETLVTGLDDPRALTLQADGAIVLSGHYKGNARLARVHANGGVDITFGTTGFVDLGLGSDSQAGGVGVDGSGRILVVGAAGKGAASRGTIARVTKTGALDSSFGLGGVVRSPYESRIAALVVQADGAAIVGGWARDATSTRKDGSIARYLP